MAKRIPKILLTGSYWHADFQSIIASPDGLTTLVPVSKVVDALQDDPLYDLVVVAAERRNQFPHSWIEQLRTAAAPSPVVALLGSWCEGELRSGQPWPGIKRVYWHQWHGRFDRFTAQLGAAQVDAWQLPEMANDADTILQTMGPFNNRTGENWHIGVSALTHHGFSAINDMIQSLGGTTCWIERQQANVVADESLTAICVEADGWSEAVRDRLQWVEEMLPSPAPIILLLNFPRPHDVRAAEDAGVFEVISKPFQLTDILSAINRSQTMASFVN